MREGLLFHQEQVARGGLLIGRKDFFWPEAADIPDEELARSTVEQFYNKDGLPPKELLVPTALSEAGLIEQWLSGKKGASVRVVAPERGAKHQLVLLAEENAAPVLHFDEESRSPGGRRPPPFS